MSGAVRGLGRTMLGSAGLARGAHGTQGSALPFRARVTGKKGNKQFYKGKGAIKGGRHVRNGKYKMDVLKMKFLEVPDLTGFQLTPYVSRAVPKPPKGTGLSGHPNGPPAATK